MKKSKGNRGNSGLVRFLNKKMRRREKRFLMKLARAVKEDEVEIESLRSLAFEYIRTIGVNKKGFIIMLDCALIGLSEKYIKGMVLPPKIKIFDCSENGLTCLPDKIPNSLEVLNCAANKIRKLPKKLPKTLETLICADNPLEEINILNSNNLEVLCCSECQFLKKIIFPKENKIKRLTFENLNKLDFETLEKIEEMEKNGVVLC